MNFLAIPSSPSSSRKRRSRKNFYYSTMNLLSAASLSLVLAHLTATCCSAQTTLTNDTFTSASSSPTGPQTEPSNGAINLFDLETAPNITPTASSPPAPSLAGQLPPTPIPAAPPPQPTPSPSPVQPSMASSTQTPALRPSSPPPSTSVDSSPAARQLTASPSAQQTNNSNNNSALNTSNNNGRQLTANATNVQFLKPKSKFRCSPTAPCQNDGVCINSMCFCQPGFSGDSCAINVDECRQIEEPCFNNGKCVDEVNTFRCECPPGYKGTRCEESVDMCQEMQQPCLNGAKCINHRTSFVCECEPGWEGKHCENNINECLPNPCKNNATCHDRINDYECDCGNSGFTGKNCDIDYDDCQTKPCGIGAKECIDLTRDFKCVCHEGFEGKRCDIDIDECSPNPCQNNGTCKQNSLQLPHNLTGDQSATIYHDLNSSLSYNMSQFAGFTCECDGKYHGERCEELKGCFTKSLPELCNHPQAECLSIGSSYDCLISASFDGSGSNHATYKVNGELKLREIYVKYKSLTGGTIVSFETTQADSPIIDLQLNKSGLYLSGAPIKRDENIKFDELLDGNMREIRLALDTLTEIKNITLTRQSIQAEYHQPFKGCLMEVRLNGLLVPMLEYTSSLNNSFEFTENHLEVGQCRTCFEKDCLNNGHCEFSEGYDHCACPETFTGNFCESDVNECEKNYNLCHNGGTCENLHGGFKCNCKEGYRGKDCRDISDHCKAKQPCITGTCKNVNSAQAFRCECPSSHIGKTCEKRRDCFNECHMYNAQCVNNVTCACLPGRREERIMCEYVSSCEQVEGELCQNGGMCKNKEEGGYYCVCPSSYTGPTCQFLEKPQFDLVTLIVVSLIGLLLAVCATVCIIIFRSVRKARATRGTYSPSTQEKFGNSASDLLKPPQPERLI